MDGSEPDIALRVAIEMIREELREPALPLAPETRLLDIELWDSIKTIGLIIAIEERLGVTLSARDVDGIERVADVVRVVADGLGRRSGEAG